MVMKKIINIPQYFYFILVTLAIIVLFPREERFRYTFVEGKPWKYGLLTAPRDFSITKSEQQLKMEQDSVMNNFRPYFSWDQEMYNKQLERFRADYEYYSKESWTLEYKRYIEQILKDIYTYGIVSSSDYTFLKSNRYTVFKVLQDNNAIPRSTNVVFTPKSAYSYILDNCPKNLNANVLRTIDLNAYLYENMKYDEDWSEKVKQNDLRQISPFCGVVQAGEKIVDMGEIINTQTFRILSSFKQMQENQEGKIQWGGLIAGISILTVGLMLCFLLYLVYFREKIYASKKNVIFLLFISSFFIFLTEICVGSDLFNVYIIPYAIIPIVVQTFFDSRTAQMLHLATTLICSLVVPYPFEFILLQLFICVAVIYAMKNLNQRSELVRCAVYILATYVIAYIGFQFFQEGGLSKMDWKVFISFCINFLFVMFAYPFIYILEKTFGYISNVTLIELSDINLPILRQFSERCPGTFQHSLQVSMLGTAAATKVGANPQMVRTGALYHDLGKMDNPAYFIENRMEGTDPHDNLSYEQSAQIIINHVPEGVEKAEGAGLPPVLVKFIQTHHGAGKVKYFYNSFKNANPGKWVDEQMFTYPGINPDTKETAILLMADSVEAASRSLKDYNEESIRDLVNRIIDGQIAEGLLNDAPLTFKNISVIKNVFVEKLLSVYHSRISYPELK
jgi:putative nucleotidyltransferase with HDIG domain